MDAGPPLDGAPALAATPDGLAAEPREGARWLASLVAYWFGLNFLWAGFTTVILPRMIELAVSPAIKGTALAVVTGLQAVIGIVVQPISGAASDRIVSPWGRRRPLMVAGVAVQVALLGVLVFAHSYLAVLVVVLLVETASNTAQGPYQGLLPDLIPAGRRGLASGLMGASQLGGSVIGVALAGVAVALGDLPLAIALVAAAVGIGMITTVVGVSESQGVAATPESPRPGLREMIGWLGHLPDWARALQAVVLEVWGRDVLEHRDYIWLLVSRLAILMATGTLQPFVLYLLEDSLGMSPTQAAIAVAPLAGLVAFVALAAAIPGGAMTARWGRVNTIAMSAVFGGVGSVLFAVAPNYVSLFPIAIPFGMALGIFLSADWALMADIIPPEHAGRYMGLSNTVTAGSALLAVALGGPLADLVNSWQYGLGYRAIFLLAALEFVIGAWCIRRVHEPNREAT
jgi:MFS family permease